MPGRTQGSLVRVSFGPAARVSTRRPVRNPDQSMSYVDEDTLAVVKRLASEYGTSKHVKLFHNSTPDHVWHAADKAEKGQRSAPSGPLEVFGMTQRKGVYGYAPSGLVEAALDAVDQIRAAKAEAQWKRTQARVDAESRKLAAGLVQLEKKYGPRFAGLVDKFEAAVEQYETATGVRDKQAAARKIEKVLAPVAKQRGTAGSAARAFMRTLFTEPGKEINPRNPGNWAALTKRDAGDAMSIAKWMLGSIATNGLRR